MHFCPICRSAWPQGVHALHHAVCAACFAVFEQHEGKWQHVPPGWNTSAPIPFPLGTALRLRSVEYRVAGFASYSYQEEYGRDQWETFERHEYTLTDVAGANPRLLCWTSRNWFLARPVDPALVTSKVWAEAELEGRAYKMRQPQSFTSDRACGYLTHPFRWRELVSIADFVSDGHVIAAERPGREYRWAGEFLDARELLTAFALTEFPAAYRNSARDIPEVAPVAVSGAVPRPKSGVRIFGILLAVLAIFAAIGTAAYQYERRTKPIESQWFACELKPSPSHSVKVPAESTRAELDPHLPQGALQYRMRVLSNSGGAAAETHDGHLDMHPKRRSASFTLPGGAASIETACSLTVRIAGLDSWPVELRFFR